MQPFQCDLQPEVQETHRTTHTGTTLVAKHRGGTKTTPAATAAHRRYLSSSAAATLHGKTQGFVLRLPPHNNIAHAIEPMQQSCSHSTANCNQRFPCNIHAAITSLPHHFPSSTLPSSPLPFLTASHRHHFPSSPLPFLTTSHRHHFPSSPLSVITTSLPHHFPSSPLPFLTTSLPHQFPSSPTSFDYVLLDHAPPFIIVNSRASYSFVMYC